MVDKTALYAYWTRTTLWKSKTWQRNWGSQSPTPTKSCSSSIRNWKQKGIYTAEVVRCFDDIVHIDGFICNTDGVGLKDVSRLIMRQSAAFDVVGIIRQINLYLMVDTAGKLGIFLSSENLQQLCRIILLLMRSGLTASCGTYQILPISWAPGIPIIADNWHIKKDNVSRTNIAL